MLYDAAACYRCMIPSLETGGDREDDCQRVVAAQRRRGRGDGPPRHREQKLRLLLHVGRAGRAPWLVQVLVRHLEWSCRRRQALAARRRDEHVVRHLLLRGAVRRQHGRHAGRRSALHARSGRRVCQLDWRHDLAARACGRGRVLELQRVGNCLPDSIRCHTRRITIPLPRHSRIDRYRPNRNGT